jgi:uncharacterized protein (DUF2237 family)
VSILKKVVYRNIIIASISCFVLISAFGLYIKNMEDKNVLGTPLKMCCSDPVTGFYRNGLCVTGPTDYGTHIVCAMVTQEFLDYSKSKGNDLITCRPEFNFPGLKPGDKWCLCISRWIEAYEAKAAPPIDLEATHEKALDFVSIEVLKMYNIALQN